MRMIVEDGRDIKPDGTVVELADSKGNKGQIPIADGVDAGKPSGKSYYVEEIKNEARTYNSDPRYLDGGAPPPEPGEHGP